MEFSERRTGRLLLRRPQEEDIDRITALCQDADIVAFTTVPHPYRREHAESFVNEVIPRGWATGEAFTWGICRADRPDLLLGVVSIADVGDGEGTLGYWLGATHRGHGYTSEAVESVIGFGFDDAQGLGLHRIAWEALAENVASARVAQAHGFRWEGVRRSAVVRLGRRHDLVLAGLLRSDERTRRQDWPTGTGIR